MTTTQDNGLVEIAYYGEVAPGHEPDAARRKLIAAIGIPPERVDAVFSGRRVVLKKAVPADEAPRYLAKLERIGILARSEAQAAPEPPTSQTAPPAPAPRETAPVAYGEQVTCPSCGARQPKRTLCKACATDIPRYAAAQAKIKAEERAASLAALKASAPGAPAADDGIEYAVEGAGLVGTRFAGRIGRIAYLVGGSLLGTAGIFALLIAFKTHVWLLLPLLLVGTFLSLRLAVLRCHDIAWSGWWSLLMVLPYVGALFSLALLVVPGTRGANDYGRPSRRPGTIALAASLLGFALAVLLGISQMARLDAMLAAYGVPGLQAAGEPFASIDDYDPRNNTVVMYSLTSCGYCAQKRRELGEMGIRYTELFIDEDARAQAQLEARLDEAGLPRQAYGTPIFDVNGIVLPGNPPLTQIVRHLRGRDG